MAKKLYIKGESGNPKGRPKGTKNRTTEEIRQFLQQVVDKNLDNLETDLEKMNVTNRWMILNKITDKFLPNLSKNDNQNENSGEITIKVEYTSTPDSNPKNETN